MRIIVCFVLICIFAGKAFCQTGCSKFKNGKFVIVTPQATSLLVRNGNVQTETLNNDNSTKLTFIVKWISECSYTLTPTNESLKRMPGVPGNAVITVEITKVNKNSYMQTSSLNYSGVKFSSEVFRVVDNK